MSLAANIRLYQACLSATRGALNQGIRVAVPLIELTARCAWSAHPGRFADGALENPLLDLGKQLPGANSAPLARIDATRDLTLHVASEVHPIGGHSRVLSTWMTEDTASQHALILTRQPYPVPDFLRDQWSRAGVQLVVFDPDEPQEVRAAELRALSRNATRIVLHQHPDDAIPVLAYAAGKSAPVIMFNHAHFSFSLGTSVADLVVNTLPYYGKLSQERRAARKVDYLRSTPEPMTEPVDKAAAKRELGLTPATPLILTVGYERYYIPRPENDFFRVVIRLLESQPELHFMFVGVCPEFEHIPAALRGHARVRFLGPLPDVLCYYRAADIFLESFPMPSLGSVWEAINFGEAYPVFSYSDSETIIRPSFKGWPARSTSEDQYCDEIARLLSNLEQTRMEAKALRAAEVAGAVRLADEVTRLYATAAEILPAVKPIPEMPARRDKDDYIVAEMSVQERPIKEFARSIPGLWSRFVFAVRVVMSGQFSGRQLIAGLREVLRARP